MTTTFGDLKVGAEFRIGQQRYRKADAVSAWVAGGGRSDFAPSVEVVAMVGDWMAP